jgi:hypothetical protein
MESPTKDSYIPASTLHKVAIAGGIPLVGGLGALFAAVLSFDERLTRVEAQVESNVTLVRAAIEDADDDRDKMLASLEVILIELRDK